MTVKRAHKRLRTLQSDCSKVYYMAECYYVYNEILPWHFHGLLSRLSCLTLFNTDSGEPTVFKWGHSIFYGIILLCNFCSLFNFHSTFVTPVYKFNVNCVTWQLLISHCFYVNLSDFLVIFEPFFLFCNVKRAKGKLESSFWLGCCANTKKRTDLGVGEPQRTTQN